MTSTIHLIIFEDKKTKQRTAYYADQKLWYSENEDEARKTGKLLAKSSKLRGSLLSVTGPEGLTAEQLATRIQELWAVRDNPDALAKESGSAALFSELPTCR